MELCKEKVEVWKKEEFGGEEGGVWRANRDGAKGSKVVDEEKEKREIEREHLRGQGPFGPIFRPSRPGEHGHGPVVHPNQ